MSLRNGARRGTELVLKKATSVALKKATTVAEEDWMV
jgi:hypothetical protein